ncbi:MAG: hypothetical protein AAFO51_03985 [Pseudomonadota bacterium]
MGSRLILHAAVGMAMLAVAAPPTAAQESATAEVTATLERPQTPINVTSTGGTFGTVRIPTQIGRDRPTCFYNIGIDAGGAPQRIVATNSLSEAAEVGCVANGAFEPLQFNVACEPGLLVSYLLTAEPTYDEDVGLLVAGGAQTRVETPFGDEPLLPDGGSPPFPCADDGDSNVPVGLILAISSDVPPSGGGDTVMGVVTLDASY